MTVKSRQAIFDEIIAQVKAEGPSKFQRKYVWRPDLQIRVCDTCKSILPFKTYQALYYQEPFYPNERFRKLCEACFLAEFPNARNVPSDGKVPFSFGFGCCDHDYNCGHDGDYLHDDEEQYNEEQEVEGPKDEKNHDDKYAEAEAQEKEEGDEETTANTKAVEASKRQRPRTPPARTQADLEVKRKAERKARGKAKQKAERHAKREAILKLRRDKEEKALLKAKREVNREAMHKAEHKAKREPKREAKRACQN